MSIYYVSKSGNNSWDGTQPAYVSGSIGPKLTIAAGKGLLSAGDTLYIRTGTYVEELDFSANGTSENRITIDNYQSEEVIIDGQDTIPTGSPYYFLVSVSGDYTTLRDITIHDSHGSLLNVGGDYSYAINITGIDSRETGIVAQGAYNILDGCSMTNNGWGSGIDGQTTWGSAICTVGSHTTIQNCIAYENTGEGLNAYSSATDAIIQDNIAYDNDSVNLYLDSVIGATVQRNLVYNTITDLSSGIVIGAESHQPSNLLIVNNFVMGCSVNLEIDSNVTTLSGVDVAYNTFVNSTGPAGEGYNMGVYYRSDINTYTNSTFTNNIVLEDVTARVPISVESSHSGLTFSYNCWSETVVAAAQGTGDVVGDPKLAKTGLTGPGTLTANYFKILSDSLAINHAQVLGYVTSDYWQTERGSSPDMGGHEYTEGATKIRLRHGKRDS